jgi:hypothetical protein
MRGRGAFAAALAALLFIPATSLAADPPPGAVKSDNLEYVKWVDDTRLVVEGKFDEVRGKDILVLTGRFGFKTLDVSDPKNPKPLDSFMPEGIDNRPGVTPGYWQDEDMELDTRRKLIIGALDPRHNDTDPAATGCPHPDVDAVRDPDCKSGFYVISYADPSNLRQVGDFVSLPAGHTASCIQDCKYIWTGGPARRSDQDWLGTIIPQLGPPGAPATPDNRLIGDGRPIWVTDLRDPAHPRVSDEPIDLWRNDQYTDYSHDVDEDEQGIAWVAGRGGIRGYATSGWHRDPYQNRFRRATPFDPILVAGGGIQWDDPANPNDDGVAQGTMFMHNSGRPTGGASRASGVKTGNILFGTEEDFTTPCGQSGRIVATDITDSLGGEPAQNSTRSKPYRMKVLNSFHPFLDTPETANPALGCSAHYFEIEGPMLSAAWYGQGLRLVDISNARNMRQIGYYRVATPAGGDTTVNPPSNSWDVGFFSDKKKGDYIYLFDMNRGVEVLRLTTDTQNAARMKSVTAPSLRSTRGYSRPVGGLKATKAAGGSVSYVCPLFTTPY